MVHYTMPTGHTTLLRRWINIIDVNSTLQQRREPSGCRVRDGEWQAFSGENTTWSIFYRQTVQQEVTYSATNVHKMIRK